MAIPLLFRVTRTSNLRATGESVFRTDARITPIKGFESIPHLVRLTRILTDRWATDLCTPRDSVLHTCARITPVFACERFAFPIGISFGEATVRTVHLRADRVARVRACT